MEIDKIYLDKSLIFDSKDFEKEIIFTKK